MEWYLKVLKNYATFSGRARRKEYWMFVLFNILISLAFGFIGGFLGLEDKLSTVYSLAVLIPGLAVAVRRLHDIGRSGWWLLLSFVIVIGWLVLLYFYVKEGDSGDNEYGPDPKY